MRSAAILERNGRAFAGATAAVVLLAGWAAPGWAASTTERGSVSTDGGQGNRPSGYTTFFDIGAFGISADGRFVAFQSVATNLVPGDTNRTQDLFVRDRRAGTTERVSVSPGGAEATGDSGENPFHSFGVALSAGARLVAFGSRATNLAPGDTNNRCDVFVRTR